VRRTSILVLAVCLALLAAVPPSAAGPTAPTTEEKGLRMSLADCLRRALENNLDLVIARKDPLIAEQGVAAQRAPFDPTFKASGSYQESSTDQTITNTDLTQAPPTTTEFSLPTSSNTQESVDATWAQKLRFGAQYSAQFAYNGSPESKGGRVFGAGFLSLYDQSSRNPSLTLTFNMPLLQGFGKEVNTVGLVLAKSNVNITRQALSLQSQLTMQQVENAYWDLVAAREAARVARESLKLAQDLYDLNKKKVEVGTLAPIEITQAEAGVASREEAVIIADTAVMNAEDSLLRLMAVPKDDSAWNERVLPTDRPEYQARTVDVNAALAKALDLRSEMATAREQLKNSELSERVARHETKHSLSLNAALAPSYSASSDTGSQITTGGAATPQSSTGQTADSRAWSVGLLYGYPIGNRAAKSNYEIATLNREKAEVGLKNTEQSVRVDVRTAARNVESGVKRVEAARASAVLQRKTLEAEQKKFENGMSTSFEVLRIQNDLFSAQLAEIQAILSYTKSLADIERAQGTLLEARGLRIDKLGGK
jgi:outer membrane protein TolC